GLKFHATPPNLEALPVGFMLQRMLNNLKGTYLRAGDFGRAVRIIERLRQLAPHDPLQRRDLGASLLQDKQPGRAIDHLRAYLEAVPEAGDAAAIERLLAQARGQVAAWN